ncbi:anti-sigma factor family protein [Leptolyngbya sp. 7M]|uniref:anti-sigma factor family protein n=1 Tax=Leptolyngbya sp. 7M TaxID=2812896 RepID=UPI001B8B9485|nr:hypothetical protein [Leptolyngbya sp. 7M]QYO66507.1 hypothetical protein JVX88_06825 [Leptolyngbya sp. 7M]
MSDFVKTENCPSSHLLNAFQLGECEAKEGLEIRLHLRGCEFCRAESEFYARFPQQLENYERSDEPAMPPHLRELAETLLNKNRGASALAGLISEGGSGRE